MSLQRGGKIHRANRNYTDIIAPRKIHFLDRSLLSITETLGLFVENGENVFRKRVSKTRFENEVHVHYQFAPSNHRESVRRNR